jgi:hypothetical protein
MEYFKDYDFDLKYHPMKANKATDSLSRKEIHRAELMILEYDLMEKFCTLTSSSCGFRPGFYSET